MKIRLVEFIFILIGILVGIIASLQIRADPIKVGSFPLEQLEIQKSLLNSFSAEQEDLKEKLAEIEEKLKQAQKVVIERSAPNTLKTLAHLKSLTGFDTLAGEGMRIILNDSPFVTRGNFSTVNEHFVQATDVRDLMNMLFLKDAQAIALNGRRVLPLTSVVPVFDSILVGNFQMSPPFVIEAIGDPIALREAIQYIKKRKIQIFVDERVPLTIGPVENVGSFQFMSLAS